MKKRIISLVLSVVVLVGCVVINNSNTASLTVGAGNGIDERLETAKELSDFLAFVAERDISNMGATYSLMAAKLAAEEEENEDQAPQEESKYKSASIQISTQITAESTSSNAEYTGGVIRLKQNASRQLNIYINEDSTYYVTKGIFSLMSKTTKGESTEVFNFDMEIAIIEESVYLMFHDFLYVEDNISRRIKPSMADQWIEAFPSMAIEFVSIDSVNRETMEALKELVELLDACNALDEEVGITDLDTDDLNRLYLEDLEKQPEEDKAEYDKILFGNGEDVKLTIDLSNTANPYISIINTQDKDDTETIITERDPFTWQPITTVEVRTTSKVESVQEISICNVNNTVINMDTDSVSISIKEEDGEDAMFIVKETKKDD
ncbi:MAG: hypothetical protein J6K14_07915 [Clostridia bacterium]|nr:hypothetical protein [Clostridia bacterium]